MTLALGIDVGTQSLKGLLLDSDRGVLGVVAEPLDLIEGLPDGHSEQHPEHWLSALRRAVPRLLQGTGRPGAGVAAIGVSGQQHGLVSLDADHRVIRPAKLWNDVSSAPQCEAVRRALGPRLFELTGNHLPPGFTGGKLRWLYENEPDHYRRLALVLLPHDYVNLYLTGEPSCEAGDASGTGFFDVAGRRFASEVLAALGPDLERRLPPLRGAGEAAGRLTAAAAAELGLRAGTPVSTGGGDNMMAAIGAGAVRPGVAVMSLGTSGTVFACAERPVCDPAGEIAAFCDSAGHWLPLGCTMNATVSTELGRALLGVGLADVDATAAAAPAGCDGLLCLPFFTGERSPDLPRGTGALLGLTPRTMRPSHVLRAAMEGATFALTRLLDRLVALGLELHELRLCGGGSHSALWRRIVASAAGRPVVVGVHADAAALGAAVQALWTLERLARPGAELAAVFADLDLEGELCVLGPDPCEVEIYRQRRTAYEHAVETLTPWYRRGGEP